MFICQGSLSQDYCLERRRRDLNPRAAINDLHPFQGCPFNLLGTSPSQLNNHYDIAYGVRRNLFQISKRRGWDSNPRALADKRFSRPPRYDHFDTSPLLFRCFNGKTYNIKNLFNCQQLFCIFFTFFFANNFVFKKALFYAFFLKNTF